MVGGLKALPSGYVAEVLLVGLLGIVFVMTTKSSLTASLLVMAGAVALGLVSCLPLWFTARRPARGRISPRA